MQCDFCGRDLTIEIKKTHLGYSMNILECECGFLMVENEEGDEFILQEPNSERDM